jgi:hypothetical protein
VVTSRHTVTYLISRIDFAPLYSTTRRMRYATDERTYGLQADAGQLEISSIACFDLFARLLSELPGGANLAILAIT